MRDEQPSSTPESGRVGADQEERTALLPTHASDSLRTESGGYGNERAIQICTAHTTEAQGSYRSPRLRWCRRRDLNPHGLRHTPLKRACLPFHHFGTQQELEKPPQLRSRIAQTLNVLSSTSRDFARCGLVARLFEAPATQYAPNRLSPCLVPAFHASRFTNDAGQPEGAAL